MPMLIRPQLLALVMSASIAPALMAQTTITDDGLALESEQARTMGFADALSLAKQNDPELKYAYHSYKAEQEADDISRANLLPNISLSSSYRYSNVDDYYTREKSDVDSDNLDYERSRENQHDYSYQLNLQQSLVNVSAWKAYSSAKEAVRQSQFSYNRAEQELIYRLSEAYLKTLLAAQRVYITQEKLESLQLKLDQTTRMNELGVGDRLNVLRARSSRDVAKSDLLQAKGLLDDARTALENITGQMISMPDAWIKNGHLVLPSLLVGEQQAWLDQVPDNAQVLAELSNVRAKELESEASKAQHLPTLNFQLTYLDRTSDDLFTDSARGIASLNLEIPIYSGGKTSAQARQAEAGRNAAQVRYEKALSDTRQAVKLAYTQLNSYHNRLLALDESRRSGQAYLEAAERQADLSLGSQVDVLEARTELYDIRLEFAKTLSDYLLADLNLLLETGQLNDAALVRYDQLFDQDS